MLSPFAITDARIVRRSAAIVGGAYASSFSWNGCVKASSLLTAWIGTVVTSLFFGMLSFPPFRWLAKKLLPKPGEGPSEELRENGYFKFIGVGKGEVMGDTPPAEVRVKFDVRGADPGYKGTAMMLTEAAMCLVEGTNEQVAGGNVWKGGVLTPASAFGGALVRRLNKQPNVVVEVLK